MKTEPESTTVLSPLNPIRVETGISRYPVHRLAKHGSLVIDIRQRNEAGEVSIKWEVNHVSKFGQPGPLAYKLDTLVVNRRIEEAVRPIPRMIRLGSLSEICRELGQVDSGKNTNHLKNALRQNAFAAIIAKIRYRLTDGTERMLEADFNRYSVVFTGEHLPDGRKADAVYIVLNDVFMQVINGAMTRPLDYDYLKTLPPTPQRFYELLSYQMYATLKHDRARAKLRYSEFCTYAPQVRYLTFDKAKKQMYKIHLEHRKSGYIAKVDYQHATDAEGNPDWIMLYKPGPKAEADYRTFTKRGGPSELEVESFDAVSFPALLSSEPSPLEAELIKRGITAKIAGELADAHGEETIREQIEILKWRLSGKKAEKIDDPAAWLVSAIKHPHAPPKGFISQAERERRAEASRQNHQAELEARRLEREAEAIEKRERDAARAYWDKLTPEQQQATQAAADAGTSAESLALETGPLKSMGQHIRRDEYIRRLLTERQPAEA